MKLIDVVKGNLQPESGSAAQQKSTFSNDTRKPIRLGIIILLIGFGGFLLWAAFAPLDEGVPSQGIVSIATKSKVVEHLHGGRVEAVHVREGQMVKQGDVLITLDSQAVKARYDEIHQHYLGVRAAESRLLAEQRGAGSIAFHRDVLNDPDRRLAAQHMQTQTRVFYSRQTTLRLLENQLKGISDLVHEGYAPLNQQQELEMRIAQHRAETATQLAELQLEVEADAQKVKALALELENTEIRAPANGQVVGLQVQTVGAVIQPGQKVMDIVPLDETLLVEVKVEPHLIDRIHAGLIADVRFSSFSNSPQLVVDGKVESVSKDLLINPQMNPAQPGSSYYLALISITPDGIKKLGGRKMQPGMPVEAVIKTGERSLLTYLLHPLIKRISASMKEE